MRDAMDGIGENYGVVDYDAGKRDDADDRREGKCPSGNKQAAENADERENHHQDEIQRVIEIRSNQNFEEFHNAIQKAIGFDNSKSASFYMSDDYWRKGREITLKQADIDPGSKKIPKLMKASRLLDFIEDPRQKILYLFDFDAQWSFTIELLKIQDDEQGVDYPQCVKSSGHAPKQYKPTTPPDVDEDDEEDESLPKKETIFHHEEGIDRGEHDEDDDPFGEEKPEESEEGESFAAEGSEEL